MQLIAKLWRQSAPLTATSLLMLFAFGASLAGVALDHRTITGVSAWLKPAKFALSTAIFSTTIAWMFGYLTINRRVIRSLGWVIATVLVLEVSIIDAQAARGTISHFNTATVLDGVLFGVMGVAIAVLWLAIFGVSLRCCARSSRTRRGAGRSGSAC